MTDPNPVDVPGPLLDSPYGPQDRLEPPNPKPHIVLPPPTVSVHKVPLTAGSVLKVYSNALAFVDQISAMRGYMAAGGAMGMFVSLLGLSAGGGWGFSLVGFAFVLVSLAFLQLDFTGFRYQPVLVDRGTRQVHIFVSHMLPWWQWFWKLWGRSGYEVQSFDWRCVRAEVIEYTIFTGQIPRRESALVLAFTEAPGSSHVIQRVGLGPSSAYGDIDSLVRRWEHVRRFMQEDGPLWLADDAKYQDEGTTVKEGLTFLQPLLSPMWADSRENGGAVFWVASTAALLIWPLTAAVGLIRWLSYVLNAEPVWPREVAAGLGKPLSDAELAQRFKAKEPTIVGRKKRRALLGE
jgi:hypothetical protein